MNTLIGSIATMLALTALLSLPAAAVDQADSARVAEAAKEWPQAAELWERLATTNPTSAVYPLNAGNDWYQAKEFAKAIPDFEKANALGVSFKWDMPYVIACCHALLGQKQEALRWLTSAMNLGYRDLNQLRTDTDLESLHSDPHFIQLAAITDVSKMDRTEGYRYDLWLLNRELRRLHYSPYRRHTKREFDQFVGRLEREIPTLTDPQIAVRFKQLAAMTGDGHTQVVTRAEDAGEKRGLPVIFRCFAEGMFVTGTDTAHADLLGSQVLKIGGRPIEEVRKATIPICSYDNSMWIMAREPGYLRIPALLNGLGLIPSPDSAALTVKDVSGRTRDVTLAADTESRDWRSERTLIANPVPFTFFHRDKGYWFELMPGSRTVFCQYNQVVDIPDESIEKFSARLFRYIDEHDVDRLILDMRWNGGGNNFLNKPLLLGLIKSKINQHGKLFVLVGRDTFSAAMCGAAQIERYTNAIFAGEPTGSSPNFIGETIRFALPYSHIRGAISDLYWQNSTSMDNRTWIAPEIYVPPTFADYAANRDPVIDAIMAYGTKDAPRYSTAPR